MGETRPQNEDRQTDGRMDGRMTLLIAEGNFGE